MFRVLVGALGALALSWPAAAQVTPFPGDFRTHEITTDDGATIHIRVGGQGPAVVLLHGFASSVYTWKDVLPVLARDYDVVALDLPGFGESDLTWQVFATIGWRFSDWGSVVGGYRYLSLEYETAEYKADLALYGPAIGLAIRF